MARTLSYLNRQPHPIILWKKSHPSRANLFKRVLTPYIEQMSNPFDSLPDDEMAPHASGGIAARALAASRGAPVSDYFSGLNPEQTDAVQTLEGPLLVLAGAGTGKTRVLTTRIAHILATGSAWPSQILAVTFTNKAAREMKDRIGSMVGEAVEGMPWLGTFHSICVKILRQNAELVGLKSDFTILDTDDQIRLLKQIIRAEGIDDKRWPARTLAGLIDGWKNKGLAPGQISEGDARAFADGRGRELYQQYQDRLKVLNATDFGDLLTECIRLFNEHHDVLAEYQRKFRYILVDEYQDTNVAQYLWLRLLAQTTPLTRTALREGAPSGTGGSSPPDETSPSVAGQAGEARCKPANGRLIAHASCCAAAPRGRAIRRGRLFAAFVTRLRASRRFGDRPNRHRVNGRQAGWLGEDQHMLRRR